MTRTLDSLLGAVRQLSGIRSDRLQLTGGTGSLILSCDAVERNIVQLLNLGDVLLNPGDVFLDRGHLGCDNGDKQGRKSGY